MNDAVNNATARPVEVVTLLKQSSLGHPLAELAANENINKVFKGLVIGYAVQIYNSKVEDRETGEIKQLRSLGGSFRAVPEKADLPIRTSNKLGLPAHIMQPVVDLLEEQKGTGLIVQVAWKLYVERSKNAAGYSWVAEPLMELGVDDPLAKLQAEIESGGKLKSLPAPVSNVAQINPTPAPAEHDHEKDHKKKRA